MADVSLEDTVSLQLVDDNIIETMSQDIPGYEFGTQQAELFVKKFLEIFATKPDQKFHVLASMDTEAKMSSGARKIYVDFAANPQIGKVALYGGGRVIRIASKFVISASGKADTMRLFATRDEALAWLRET